MDRAISYASVEKKEPQIPLQGIEILPIFQHLLAWEAMTWKTIKQGYSSAGMIFKRMNNVICTCIMSGAHSESALDKVAHHLIAFMRETFFSLSVLSTLVTNYGASWNQEIAIKHYLHSMLECPLAWKRMCLWYVICTVFLGLLFTMTSIRAYRSPCMLVCRTDYNTLYLLGPGGRPAPNQGVCALSASGPNI